MDPTRFDDIAKKFAHGLSRRSALKGLGGSALGGLFALAGGSRVRAGDDHDDDDDHDDCRRAGKRCEKNRDCCSDHCRGEGEDRRCVCTEDGQCPHPPAGERQCKKRRCHEGACVIVPKPAGTPCSDGDKCTVDDVCDGAGACHGTPKDCNDGNPCTKDRCNPRNGHCVHRPLPDGTACPDDGISCTRDFCREGQCVHERTDACCHSDADCDDGNPCTADSCDPATGDCVHTPISDIPCQPPLGENGLCQIGDCYSICVDPLIYCAFDSICHPTDGTFCCRPAGGDCTDGPANCCSFSCADNICL